MSDNNLKQEIVDLKAQIEVSRDLFTIWFKYGKIVPEEVSEYLKETQFNSFAPEAKEMLMTIFEEITVLLDEYTKVLKTPGFENVKKAERIKELLKSFEWVTK